MMGISLQCLLMHLYLYDSFMRLSFHGSNAVKFTFEPAVWFKKSLTSSLESGIITELEHIVFVVDVMW